MNKRLRKKKREKEFGPQEFVKYGLDMQFRISPSKVDEFIDQVESIGYFCNVLSGIEGNNRFTIEIGQKIQLPTQFNYKVIAEWLRKQERADQLTIERIWRNP